MITQDKPNESITEYKTRLKNFILNNKNGFTINFNINKARHKKGFYVALTDNSSYNIDTAINTLLDLRILFLKEPINKTFYIGGWIDSKTNLFYLDLTIWINNKQDALKVARQYNQKAVFDVASFESIYL